MDWAFLVNRKLDGHIRRIGHLADGVRQQLSRHTVLVNVQQPDIRHCIAGGGITSAVKSLCPILGNGLLGIPAKHKAFFSICICGECHRRQLRIFIQVGVVGGLYIEHFISLRAHNGISDLPIAGRVVAAIFIQRVGYCGSAILKHFRYNCFHAAGGAVVQGLFAPPCFRIAIIDFVDNGVLLVKVRGVYLGNTISGHGRPAGGHRPPSHNGFAAVCGHHRGQVRGAILGQARGRPTAACIVAMAVYFCSK